MAIYFVQADIGGPIKIGYAVDAAARIRILQTGCPFPLRVLSVVDGEPRDECALHERFAASRDHGEWFKPTSDLLAHLAGAGAVPDDVSPRFRLVMRAMRTHPEDARGTSRSDWGDRRAESQPRWPRCTGVG